MLGFYFISILFFRGRSVVWGLVCLLLATVLYSSQKDHSRLVNYTETLEIIVFQPRKFYDGPELG